MLTKTNSQFGARPAHGFNGAHTLISQVTTHPIGDGPAQSSNAPPHAISRVAAEPFGGGGAQSINGTQTVPSPTTANLIRGGAPAHAVIDTPARASQGTVAIRSVWRVHRAWLRARVKLELQAQALCRAETLDLCAQAQMQRSPHYVCIAAIHRSDRGLE
jgi:hypothetical protein